MNRDRSKGNWKQLASQVRPQRGKFTDDDLDLIDNPREQFAAKPQKRYSIAQEEAELRLKTKATKTNAKWLKP